MVDHRDIDRDTKIRVLRSAASHVTGNEDRALRLLPDIAHRAGLTLEQVKAIVEAHGWPRPKSMMRAADILTAGKEVQRGDLAEVPQPASPRPAAPPADDRLVMVETAHLAPDPDNVRDDLGDLSEMVASIEDMGILQPIVARRHQGKLMIVMGHRRHAAAKIAGLKRVPVIVRAGAMSPDEVLAAMILENGQRRDLDPIEEARALSRLKAADKATDDLLAERISKSQPYVSGRLALLSLTSQQQAAVRAGTLPLARAIKLGREQGGITRPRGPEHKQSSAHLSWDHPLAERVAVQCERLGHHKNKPGRPGGVGCGSCWEATIRADERAQVAGRAEAADA